MDPGTLLREVVDAPTLKFKSQFTNANLEGSYSLDLDTTEERSTRPSRFISDTDRRNARFLKFAAKFTLSCLNHVSRFERQFASLEG